MSHKNINIGDVITVAGIEWIVLDKREQVIMCLTKNCICTRKQFDTNTGNYANSSIRRYLNNDFLQGITNTIGEDALREVMIDLTSLDGLDDYEYAVDKVGLLTVDMYRHYTYIIEQYPVNQWWWLATAWSTPHRNYDCTVCCVSSSGALGYGSCRNTGGVRPFCIFKSSIFKSLKEYINETSK